jgi:pimeloyl-ACP methyl ester carboxylesterase
MARVREFDTDQAVRQAMDLLWERGYEASTLQDLTPDLRGSGGSDAPEGGYDKATLANEVHQLILALRLDDAVSIVGHDIRAIVAYAYAAAHRRTTRRLVLLDAPQIDEILYQLLAVRPASLFLAIAPPLGIQ